MVRLTKLTRKCQLIEQIDNANSRWVCKTEDIRADLDVDLQKLQLWEPLQSLLTSDNSSQQLKTAVLWIIGTALQNNPSAQDDVRARL